MGIERFTFYRFTCNRCGKQTDYPSDDVDSQVDYVDIWMDAYHALLVCVDCMTGYEQALLSGGNLASGRLRLEPTINLRLSRATLSKGVPPLGELPAPEPHTKLELVEDAEDRAMSAETRTARLPAESDGPNPTTKEERSCHDESDPTGCGRRWSST